jgi:uracil-DNA glycosylase
MLSDIDNTLDQPYWESRHKGIEHLNPTEWKRRNLFGDNWYNLLKVAIDSDHMSQLGKNIASLRKLSLVYPSPDRVFRAYKMCPPTYTKVIIVGQNPYYQHGVADGLAFSYLDGKPQNTRKALDEILDEIERDVYEGFNVNKHYNLDYLAKQGVFLLNSALTVEYNQPDSHLDIGWQKFTAYTLKMLYTDYRPKVFMLWGTQASNLFKQAINTGGAGAFTEVPHLILTAKHPAYDVRLRNNDLDHYNKLTYPDTFKGCKHFSRANQFLISKGKTPIKWLDA